MSNITRRAAIGLGAAGIAAGAAFGQAAAEKDGGPKTSAAPGARNRPLICGYSGNLAQIGYAELGMIAQQIGYDAIDLTILEGGHVNPHIANVDVVRAIESVRGAGLEVPMISTTLTTVGDPTAYPVLAITGRTGVHLYRTGYWRWGFIPDMARRMAEIRADLTNLTAVGRQYQMTAMIPNRAGGYFGESVWDTNLMIAGIDPSLIGFCFDPSQMESWEAPLLLIRPRLLSVVVQDYTWDKDGKVWSRRMCPLGEGAVDWELFFRILAQSRFTGPLSIHCQYAAPDMIGAQAKDIEFVRKHIDNAWKAI